ncbi:5688_t:CDS:2, partial [Gigaspora margarita]
MLSDISEPGPGFVYFLNTHCQDLDALQYHEAWKDNLNKEDIKENGTEEERRRLKNQFQFMDSCSQRRRLVRNHGRRSHGLKSNNLGENEKINTGNTFLSCNLFFEGVQLVESDNESIILRRYSWKTKKWRASNSSSSDNINSKQLHYSYNDYDNRNNYDYDNCNNYDDYDVYDDTMLESMSQESYANTSCEKISAPIASQA